MSLQDIQAKGPRLSQQVRIHHCRLPHTSVRVIACDAIVCETLIPQTLRRRRPLDHDKTAKCPVCLSKTDELVVTVDGTGVATKHFPKFASPGYSRSDQKMPTPYAIFNLSMSKYRADCMTCMYMCLCRPKSMTCLLQEQQHQRLVKRWLFGQATVRSYFVKLHEPASSLLFWFLCE
jgi:hypothetical protein